MHVILLVCWLKSITASWLSHACHAHSVLFLPMQSSLTNFWRSFTGLVQLIFSFPCWFHTIIAFSRKLHSAFRLDRKTWSQRSHVFHLTSTAALHCGHTFVGGIFTANGELAAMNVSPPLATWSRFIRMRVFRGVKKWPTYCVAVCRTYRKCSSFATKHFQRKSLISTFICRREG